MKRLILLGLIGLTLAGCASQEPSPAPEAQPTPQLPAGLTLDAEGVPWVDVYIVEDGIVSSMDLEQYVAGVVAGEMKNDWPMEALKAQAILARTFVLRFMSEKASRYEGADISTDIAEAQAYNASAVNDRVQEAVDATRGEVLCTSGGSLPYTWFHAHSGGMTALAKEGLGYAQAEPSYTKRTDGLDSAKAPESARAWTADFPAAEFLAACRKTGVDPDGAASVRITKKGDSGRAITLSVDGTKVDAAKLRMALGSTVMRSTLLDECTSQNGVVHMAGRGYGHGVGMPQWGAYALAEDGFLGEDIAAYYYDGLSVVRLWGRTADDSNV